jgi:hypothetical protein
MDQVFVQFILSLPKKATSILMDQPDEQQIEGNKPKSSAGKIYLFIVLIYLLVTVLYLVNRS